VHNDLLAQSPNWWNDKITLRQAWDNNIRNMHSVAAGADSGDSYVPGPNPFNPDGLLEPGYVPQSNVSQDRNALNSFFNPSSGSIGPNALIF